MQQMKYATYGIVFQEIPDETTLAFDISNCPYRCEGCHSQFLWEDTGDILDNEIESFLEKYRGMITCVCFMGGNQCMEDLIYLINIVKSHNLKTALYTGENDIQKVSELIPLLDYLKIGSYRADCGGLNKKTTNQIFYQIDNSHLTDKTYLFQKEKK